jgi:hypothetical protein
LAVLRFAARGRREPVTFITAYSSLRKEIGLIMKRVFAIAAICLLPTVVYAGAPLKGVDVKLGKNPGGKPAARTTNAEGKVDFGVLPAGSYRLVVIAPAALAADEALVEVKGAADGSVRKRWNFAQNKAFDADAPATARSVGAESIVFTADGSHSVDLVLTALSKPPKSGD